MDHRLVKIKRLVAHGHYRFTLKADLESARDGLLRDDIVESILMAQSLRVKTSDQSWQRGTREMIYIIESENFDGIRIYSKGVVRRNRDDEEEFYILISGKRSTRSS